MIIVTGAGRSGTTFTTQCLIEMGVDMGSNFPPPQKGSPKGCLEDIGFRALHIVRKTNDITKAEHHDIINELINTRKEPWGFKDPRSSYYIHEYMQYKPFIIDCYRNPDDVAKSLNKHYGTPIKKGYAETIARQAALSMIKERLVLNFDSKQSSQSIKMLLNAYITT